MPLQQRMDPGDGFILSEVSQTNKDRYHIRHIHGNLKKKWVQMNSLTKNRNRVTDVVENKPVITRQGEEGVRINWEIGIEIYMPVYNRDND